MNRSSCTPPQKLPDEQQKIPSELTASFQRMTNNKIFWLFTASVFTILLIPQLVQDGMFLDGITYAAISKNLANGIGTFWKPHYTKTMFPDFYEHPPLVFMVQSYFFRVFGDGIYAERIFSFITAALTAWGIILCWRLFNRENELREYAWLPVLLWITVPVVGWAYVNNILENLTGVFTLFSVYFISRAIIRKQVIWLVLAAALMVMGFLSKGFVSLFPLATVAIYGLAIDRQWKWRSFTYSLLTGVFLVVLGLLVFLALPGLKENVLAYLNQQLLPALHNQREITTNNHLSILFKLLLELTVPLLLLLFFVIRAYRRKQPVLLPQKFISLYFLLIGLSASLPLIITLKQRKFYLIPSFPFFILALSFLLAPFINRFLLSLSEKALTWIKRTAFFIFAVTLVYSVASAGRYWRDENKLHDLYLIAAHVPEGTIMGATAEVCQDLGTIAYLTRIGYLSLDCEKELEYYLAYVNATAAAPAAYQEVKLGLKQYRLFQKTSR